MKKYLSISVLLLIGLTLVQMTSGQEENIIEQPNSIIKLMTYNLKFASPTFEPSWEIRREMQVKLIRKYNPDIIGTQEGLKEQIDYLAEQLPEYVAIGEGRKGGDDDEHMVIFYKKDKFRLREMQSFQLSNTPEIIGSGPEVNPRMVTWARFALIHIKPLGKKVRYPQDYRGHWDNTSEFYVFNTHFFSGPQGLARKSASKLVMERINYLKRFGDWTADRPIFLMGDFNCLPGSIPYRILVDKQSDDKLRNAKEDRERIDWILYRGSIEILKYEVVDYNVKGQYPSDHKPIYVEVLIPDQSKKTMN